MRIVRAFQAEDRVKALCHRTDVTFLRHARVVPGGDRQFDGAGNLYGTTDGGTFPEGCSDYGCGVVFKIALQDRCSCRRP